MFRATLLSLALLATPAVAASHYRAEPTAMPASAKFAVRDTIWKCAGSVCSAGPSNSRPAIVCAVLAREVGTLRSFAVAGAPFAAEDLEKCNARAR